MTSHIPTTTIPNLEKQVRLNLKRANGWQPIYVQGAPGLAKTHFWRNNAPEIIADELGCRPEAVGVLLVDPRRFGGLLALFLGGELVVE